MSVSKQVSTSNLFSVPGVRLVDSFEQKTLVGTLYSTETSIFFTDYEGSREIWVFYSHISNIQRGAPSAYGSTIIISCKNFSQVHFIVGRIAECENICKTIKKSSQFENYFELPCFKFVPIGDELQPRDDGWEIYDHLKEFERMQISSSYWNLSTLNFDYSLCPTYTKYLYFPVNLPDTTIKGCASFRSKERLPTLTYYHHSSRASIIRCSQPLTGIKNNKNQDDIDMLDGIAACSPTKTLIIVDTRPKINAIANRAAGKGYENIKDYKNCDYHFFSIENIHVMRDSLQKLTEACQISGLTCSQLYSLISSSSWLKHIQSILESSLFVVKCIYEKATNVLVHCSDGWDRTSQTCALACLMLDSYYRTIKGYQILIEKDFLSFGFMFSKRCGHLATDNKETSPIFLQFLECTWQLMRQFPTSFEFNESFLISIHDHLHSCLYGTFIGCSEKERRDLLLKEKTYSYWADVIKRRLPEFVNPIYDSTSETKVLLPCLMPQALWFWKNMYCRGIASLEITHDIFLLSRKMRQHNLSLISNNGHLDSLMLSIEKKRSNSNFPSYHDSPSNYDKTCTENSKTKIDTSIIISDELIVNDDNKKTHLLSVFNEETHNTVRSLAEITSKQTFDFQRSLSAIGRQMNSWNSYDRVRKRCQCGRMLGPTVENVHCWQCAEAFCGQCLYYNHGIELPRFDESFFPPLCKPCKKSFISDG